MSKQIRLTISAILLIFVNWPTLVAADHSASTNYQVNETFFGAGGELNACSTNYCSKQSAGETAVGNSTSANFQSNAGFNTDREPYLEFQVSNTNVDLGTLSTASTTYTTATFSVKSYLSHGYTVVNASDPPSNNGYTMHNLTTPTSATVGTEQFGINLVANTSPASFGANPVQQPSSTFGFGQVSADYDTPNLYKYLKNDTVAYSVASSSFTDYTISYIFNVSHVTPGGTYHFNHVLVATATF